MPKVRFIPGEQEDEFEAKTKILKAALRLKTGLRFGCAACRCGQCAVKITKGKSSLSPMRDNERELLEDMNLDTSGEIRLACQARITEEDVEVDQSFQDEYDPDA